MANFERNKPGERLDFGGIDLVHPVDQLPPNKFPYAQNIRRYVKGAIKGRNLLTASSILPYVETSTSAGSIVNTGDQTVLWTNPGYWTQTGIPGIGNAAGLAIGSSSPTANDTLLASTFGFSIPVGATITGITISTSINLTSGSGVSGTLATAIGGVAQQSFSITSVSSGNNTYTNTFSGTPWTPATVNGSLQVSLYLQSAGLSAQVYANSLTVTVNYTYAFNAGSAIHSLKRLNDSTPNGPASGYTLIMGAGTGLYEGSVEVAVGLSGNPLSLIPFRPNTSVQPWMYEGDSAPQGSVTLTTKYLTNGNPVNFICNGMNKVRSDGIAYKMGIKEPQLAPVVSTEITGVTTSGNLLASAIPWSNNNPANPSFNYGHTDAYHGQPGGVAPFNGTVWYIINVLNASTVKINSLTPVGPTYPVINGTSITTPAQLSTTSGTLVGSGYPGNYIQTAGSPTHPTAASLVVGAFIDASGNVITSAEYGWVAPNYIPIVVDIGASVGTPITVPYNAVSLYVGINSSGNTFDSNTGSITVNSTVTTNALPAVTSILGSLTAYYFGDSPQSGPVAQYIWKNPEDPGGSGPTRSISSAVGSTTGNSFIFDATFGTPTPGIPSLPGVGNSNLPMMWTSLNPESVAIGSTPVFAAPITTTYANNTQYANFNFCLTGNIYFPSGGPGQNYTFVLTNQDNLIWGIGGGVTLVSSSVTTLSSQGQTITVVGGYPLLPSQYIGSEPGTSITTVTVNPPAPGIYPIEVDYDYWYDDHETNGRILLIMASPKAGAAATIIPPLSGNVRQEVQYRCCYRSSATGATSNPSPESTAESVPVTANTVTSLWSDDPQVDVVDYYRIDSVTASFTYVATGPNDNLGVGGTNTPITDSLLDTELSSKLLDYDNYEPFPSIDLPQKGVCNVSGGVITWVSGGAIGGTATGFNNRWLAGTTILIGSPTSLAYTFISRPVSNTITIPGVPDGTALAYEIDEPILAAQPLPYMWGPTDNVNYAFAVGDPLRPGTLYWCKGSNLDSAPDTNQLDVTDPAEPLVGGAISAGLGVLFSIKRGWLILPNFSSATATATGTTGSTWTLQESGITRGLYMPRCVCVSGGGNIFFRVDDGIHISAMGSASKSITDSDIYNLFPHEDVDGGTSVPKPVTIAGYTVYPPNDSLPNSQRFSYNNGYLYYDYLDSTSTPRTLVYDEAAEGWIVDFYTPSVTIHASDEGQSTQGVLAGCSDGTIRLMSSAGTEVATAVLLTPAFDKGDTRATAKWGDLYIETANP